MTDNQSFTDQDRDDPAFAASRSMRLETPAGGGPPPRPLLYWNALPQWQRCSELLEWIGLGSGWPSTATRSPPSAKVGSSHVCQASSFSRSSRGNSAGVLSESDLADGWCRPGSRDLDSTPCPADDLVKAP